MATVRKYPRKRSNHLPVMLSDEEKIELRQAADRAGLALSVFIRVVALEAARSPR